MIKQKIDLDNLLAKYEKGNGLYTQPDFYESKKHQEIEENFYGKRSTNNQIYSRTNYKTTGFDPQQAQAQYHQSQTQGAFIGNFKMSKNECEAFLVEIQKQLNQQKKLIVSHSQTAYRQITERFNRNHDKIRKQILQLLDQAFRENEKMMKEELLRQSRNQHVEFNQVKLTIQSIEDQISGYVRHLSGPEYKKAIADVVTKDFSYQMERLQKTVNQAKNLYLENLGEVQPDTIRIQCLKNDLKHLFYFKKKTAKLIQKSIFQVIIPPTNQQNNYNESKVQGHHSGSRTRKSFFNFGN